MRGEEMEAELAASRDRRLRQCLQHAVHQSARPFGGTTSTR